MKKCYYFPTWEEQGDIVISLDNEYIALFKNEVIFKFEIILESNSSDPILAKLCELTGAKMYGDYLLMHYFDDNNKQYTIGNIYGWDHLLTFGHHIMDSGVYTYKGFGFNNESLDGCYVSIGSSYDTVFNNSEYYSYKYNIFHEYSKFLRKEENKFEEIKKILLC